MPDRLPRVLPDNNVCYPLSLLHLVLRCDEQDLHRVAWTDDILDELVDVWVRNGARSRASARVIADPIRAAFDDQQIPRSDYDHVITEMPGTDEDDHVHAAAAVAAAPSILLTANTKDFPTAELEELGVAVRHPDDYFVDLLASEPNAVREVLAGMSRDRQHPPMKWTMSSGHSTERAWSASPLPSTPAERRRGGTSGYRAVRPG